MIMKYNMIERVARALCVSDATPPDRPVSSEDNTLLWELHKKAAHAAIAAMREPTKDMAQTVAWAYTAGVANPEMITKIYSAVVDAALAGK